MSDHTLHPPMTHHQPPESEAGSWKNSLRLRLLTGTLIWVLATLLLTGWGLRALFAEHQAQQLRSQLVARLDRLSAAVGFQPDQPVQVTVTPFSGDPLLQQFALLLVPPRLRAADLAGGPGQRFDANAEHFEYRSRDLGELHVLILFPVPV